MNLLDSELPCRCVIWVDAVVSEKVEPPVFVAVLVAVKVAPKGFISGGLVQMESEGVTLLMRLRVMLKKKKFKTIY